MGERRGARQWRQWSPEQAKRELDEWESSGESLAGFARRRGYSTQRLRWWRDRLAQWTGEASSGFARLVPAVAIPAKVEAAPFVPVALNLAGDLRIEVGDVAAVPPEWLAALVRELRRPMP